MKMQSPMLEVVRFEQEDVIATSMHACDNPNLHVHITGRGPNASTDYAYEMYTPNGNGGWDLTTGIVAKPQFKSWYDGTGYSFGKSDNDWFVLKDGLTDIAKNSLLQCPGSN